MSLSHAIARHTVIQFIAKILNIGLGMLSLGLMARYLDPTGFGHYTIIVGFLQFFGVLGDLGLSLVVLQLMAERPQHAHRYFANTISLRLVSATLCLGIAPLLGYLLPYPPEVQFGILLMTLSFFFSSLIQLYTTPFQAHVRMDIPAIADLVSRVALVGGIWWAMTVQAGLFAILGVILAGNAIQLGILMWTARRFTTLALAWDWAIWSEIIGRTWPIACSIGLNLVYLRADTIVLSLTSDITSVGWYGLAYRVFEVLVTVPMMVMGLVLAQFAAAWSTGKKEDFTRYFNLTFEGMVSLALPITVGGWILAEPIMRLVGGEAFVPAAHLLRPLLLASACVWIGTLYGHLINVIHAQRRMIMGYAAGAIIGLGGYLIFIPRYAGAAAAWMTLVAELTVLLTAAILFTRITHISPPLATLWRPMIATVGMTAGLLLLREYPLLITVPTGAIIYGSMLLTLGGLSRRLVTAFIPARILAIFPRF